MKLVKRIFLLLLLFSKIPASHAQTNPKLDARLQADLKDYKKAIPLYQKLYDANPNDEALYNEYLAVLMEAKEFKGAEKLALNQLDLRSQNPLVFIDLGKIFLASGKTKKADEAFEQAIQYINGDDLLTTRIANALVAMNQNGFAIKVYERAIEILKTPYFYGGPLAKLYAKAGDMNKAVNALVGQGPAMMQNGAEDTKSALLELLGNDPKKLQQAQKALIRHINEQPENNFYSELLVWLYTQKGDWEGAFIQIRALDERNHENGQKLLEFARNAQKENQPEMAIQTLDAILETGMEQPMYSVAFAEKLKLQLEKIEGNPGYKQEEVAALETSYTLFFEKFPQYYQTESLKDFARLVARFAHKPLQAIDLLEKAIKHPAARRDFVGWAKLQLGDYYILLGKIWDASLIYSQVDKAFKEDILGEEARFHNAKLSYYNGDFDWAQGQLTVLKASTSELIANDALYLSILITENTPDSFTYPLLRFAHADLLLFQNKDAEAETLLDSLTTAFPEHPLLDDILLLKSKLSIRHADFHKAIDYLKIIHEKHGEDVLGDDAVFRMAEIFEKYLQLPVEAAKNYEQLIMQYPGSTYVQTARAKLNALQAVADPKPVSN